MGKTCSTYAEKSSALKRFGGETWKDETPCRHLKEMGWEGVEWINLAVGREN